MRFFYYCVSKTLLYIWYINLNNFVLIKLYSNFIELNEILLLSLKLSCYQNTKVLNSKQYIEQQVYVCLRRQWQMAYYITTINLLFVSFEKKNTFLFWGKKMLYLGFILEKKNCIRVVKSVVSFKVVQYHFKSSLPPCINYCVADINASGSLVRHI